MEITWKHEALGRKAGQVEEVDLTGELKLAKRMVPAGEAVRSLALAGMITTTDPSAPADVIEALERCRQADEIRSGYQGELSEEASRELEEKLAAL